MCKIVLKAQMKKDIAPRIGGASGGVIAWFESEFLTLVPPGFFGELIKVALFAFIGAAIGEGVKMGFLWARNKYFKKDEK